MPKGNSGHRPAGGINSRNNKTVPVRRGTPAYGVNPGAVSQWGGNVGNKSQSGTSGYRGEAYRDGKTPAGGKVPLGNAVALNVGKGAPGAGREILGQSGTQSCYGTPASGQPKPGNAGKDILREFGPDSKR
jgi:hypothetical protein